jgi:hypothetical protein
MRIGFMAGVSFRARPVDGAAFDQCGAIVEAVAQARSFHCPFSSVTMTRARSSTPELSFWL